MTLKKVNYVSKATNWISFATAQNLNDIQDEVIQLQNQQDAFVDDIHVSTDKTWSSIKIDETLDNMIIPYNDESVSVNYPFIQTEVDVLTAKYSDLDTNITNHNRKINSLESADTKHTTAITTLQSDVAANKQQISTKAAQSDLTSLQSTVKEHTSQLSTHSSKIAALENDNTTNKQKLSSLESTSNGHTSKLATHDNQLTALQTDIGQAFQQAEGSFITVTNSTNGSIQDIEILGNTIQDSSNLSSIKSVGIAREDGNYEIELKSCGKNLLDKSKSIYNVLLSVDTGGTYNGANIYNTSDYIRVFPTKTYSIQNSLGWYYCFYDTSKEFVKRITFPFKPNAEGFIKVSYKMVEEDIIQIEEGTVATSCEPYQQSTSKIILPCQLERVGDVSDRLFRREDGVWCIEKNIASYMLNGTDGFAIRPEYVNDSYVRFSTKKIPVKATKNVSIMSDKFVGLQSASVIISAEAYNSNCIFAHDSVDSNLYITIPKSSLSSIDNNGFNTWLSQNPTLAKYALTASKIIELPLDAQIQLNSYLGTTNVFTEDTVIEPTIKCTIPKSLGASIQSLNNKTDNLSQRVEAVEKLKEGSELEVTTNKKTVLVEDTNEGYITNFNIKGDTLVNLYSPNNISYDSSTINGVNDLSKLTLGKTCTIISNTNKFFGIAIYKNDSYKETIDITTTSKSIQLASDEEIKVIECKATNGWDCTSAGETAFKQSFVILEGDHTDKDISYFEGLKSVGDVVDKIEVLSCGKNLFDGNLEVGGVSSTTGDLEYSSGDVLRSINFILIPKNTKQLYTKSSNSCTIGIRFYNKNKEFVGTNNKFPVIPPQGSYYCKLVCLTSDLNVLVQLECDEMSSKYEPYKGTTKELLYKNSEGIWEKPILRKVSNSVWDSIERHSDGKYYYHKRCGEVAFEGNEDWKTQDSVNTGTSVFYLSKSGITNLNIICDKFKVESGVISPGNAPNVEGISYSVTYDTFYIVIAQTKVANRDIEGLKTWLSQNPVTVAYQLDTEEVYECGAIDLNAYDDTTLLSLETGYINPQYSCKVSARIGNVVNQIKEKTDTLEDKVGKLLDDRTKSYETESGYICVEDTDEGTVEDLKIEGKTLVNLVTDSSRERVINFNSWNQGAPLLSLKDGRYTLCIKVINNTLTNKLKLKFNGNPSIYIELPSIGFIGVFTKAVDLRQDINYLTLLDDSSSSGSATVSQILLLEGDHTQNPPNYFEGLKSVGDGVDNVEMLSNNQLWNNLKLHPQTSDFKFTQNEIYNANGFNITPSNSIYGGIYYQTYLKKGVTYNFSCSDVKNITNIRLYPNQEKMIANTDSVIITNSIPADGHVVNVKFTPTTDNPLLRFWATNGIETQVKNINISKVEEISSFCQNKKQVLFKNSSGIYEKPVLRSTGIVSDTIEKHSDGKYYYHKRCGGIVFDGSSDEAWELDSWNTQVGCTTFLNRNRISKLTSISNRFLTYYISSQSQCNKGEGIYFWLDSGDTEICITSTRLSTQDVACFRTWLQANPTTIVYQLAAEEIYEVVNLDLDSYEGETSVMFNGGAISPKISFKIASHIGNTVNVLKDRIKFLEDKLITMFKATLSGDVQSLAYELYPEDFEHNITRDDAELL